MYNNNDLPPYIALNDKVILYDGICRLCSGWAKFIIRHDTQHQFKLVTVQSPEGQALLAYFNLPLDHYETMALIEGTQIYTQSTAFIRVMAHLPWYFRFATISWLIPKFIRDYLYKKIALNRYHLFGKNSSCIMPTPDHTARFLNQEFDDINKSTYQHQRLYLLLNDDQYNQLPKVVREFHQSVNHTWIGSARVGGDNTKLLHIIRTIISLPKATLQTPISVKISYQGNEEVWVRQFGSITFTSYLGCDLGKNLMYERIGPLRFYFKLRVEANALRWDFDSFSLFHCPLPKFLAPKSDAKESASQDGKYQFMAFVGLPVLGTLADYDGELEPEPK